jgi:hypothetical protein
MIIAPQQKKTGGERRWLVKNDQGETFGPVDIETLKLWARDSRLAPTNTVSENGTAWRPVTQISELEMDWVAEVSPGSFYGPIHRQALETLKKEGSIAADAMTFQRMSPSRAAHKTQPLSPVHPISMPLKKAEAEAVCALEQQRDQERQRSRAMMKQLQQAGSHAVTSSQQETPHLEVLLEHAVTQLSATVISAQAQLTLNFTQALAEEGSKLRHALLNSQAETQREAVARVVQAFTQGTQPFMTKLTQQGQMLQRLDEGLTAIRTQIAEALVHTLTSLLDKNREETVKRLCAEMVAGREQLFERINTTLTHGREQVMRATGESQRMAVEYIMRELTTVMNQSLQAGRETLLHAMRDGWSDMTQLVTALETRMQQIGETQQRMAKGLKGAMGKQASGEKPPVVERVYVEAEAVEVIPPERPQKKRKPEPEVMNPSSQSKNGGGTAGSGSGLSMAEIEQQARRELERLGAQGMNIFKRKS